ncbi:hypothetical protein ACCO45_012644 [Purpureocillium lilacinum]|uniref:Uncharacterized protein n=1 Tax=Purpureocillium lilacinum TaxID=33203 RepID=A0ACC4D8Z7_PURLI
MSGVKRIISFGGWDFSTLPGTFHILREAVKPANRDIFQKNLVAFVNEHNLDGVDLDWEYPGAPDIPDIPAGNPEDGLNYYKFLSIVKSSLGKSRSVSFAAPASYWYLKSFPIALMARSLDYIVYMTYDLHGQWDYDNKWTSSGCPSGNCLKSHVNDTETNLALSMITKAGVPSNKIVVGVASYGRSFKMAEAGCTGPTCKFTGSPRVSNAAKGRCTDTAGYISNAEIGEIITGGKVTKQWKEAGSNLLVYNDTEWVAYMDDSTKTARRTYYTWLNFAGTSDWAVDLQDFMDGSGGDDYPDDYEPFIDLNYYSDCTAKYDSFDDLLPWNAFIPPHCMEKYIVDVEMTTMLEALKRYKKLVDGGYDEKFRIWEGYVMSQVPDQIDDFMASGKADKYFEERSDYWYNYPIPGEIKVYNPKDIIGESYDKSRDLLDRFRTVSDGADFDELMQWSDLVDAGSMPALTIESAVQSMESIVKKADEIKKKERENLIVQFITGLLFFIPFAGEAAGAAGLTAARSLLRLTALL